jgi:hypothetical protein
MDCQIVVRMELFTPSFVYYSLEALSMEAPKLILKACYLNLIVSIWAGIFLDGNNKLLTMHKKWHLEVYIGEVKQVTNPQ